MHIRRIVPAGGLLAALALAPGCISQSDEEVTGLPNTGELRIQYTINGQVDESVCGQIGADRVQLVVFVDGANYARANVPCENFAVSLDLPADTYDATVTLVDAAGNPVSDVAQLSAVRLEPGGTVRSVDFQTTTPTGTPPAQ